MVVYVKLVRYWLQAEQNAIRHRWTTVVYEDESDLRLKGISGYFIIMIER